MNSTIRTFEIYDYLRQHREVSYTIKQLTTAMNQYLKDYENPDGSKGVTLTERNIRDSLNKLMEGERVIRDESSNAHTYRLSSTIVDDREHNIKKAIIKGLSYQMYRAMALDFAGVPINEVFDVNVGSEEARWVDEVNELVEISDEHKIRLDTTMLNNLAALIECRSRKHWAEVELINPETEEVYDKPITYTVVNVLMQDHYLHCMGILLTDDNEYKGTRLLLHEIEEVREGRSLMVTDDFKRLRSMMRELRKMPGDYV